MSVWIAVPSKRPAEHVEHWAAKWRERGYRVALWRDPGEGIASRSIEGMIVTDPYPGYAQAVNGLVRGILEWDPQCSWIVTGGDDVYPDPAHTAEEIARECSKHFLDAAWPKCWHWDSHYKTPEDAIAAGAYAEQKPQGLWSAENAKVYSTFGVMQPTGDRWPSDRDCYVDRVCGSPWMGREFCLRINQGKGPLWPEYTHNFVDEELQNVALKYGVLWQRRDLVHYHDSWNRARKLAEDCPDFLKPVTGITREGRAHWAKYKQLFEQRKAAGFPESEPI